MKRNKSRTCALLLAGLAVAGTVSAGDIYKWTDAEGNVHFGDRPSGETAEDAPLLQRAIAVTRHFGDEPRIGRSSTDSNVPISRGIPAITIGRGGAGSGASGGWGDSSASWAATAPAATRAAHRTNGNERRGRGIGPGRQGRLREFRRCRPAPAEPALS